MYRAVYSDVAWQDAWMRGGREGLIWAMLHACCVDASRWLSPGVVACCTHVAWMHEALGGYSSLTLHEGCGTSPFRGDSRHPRRVMVRSNELRGGPGKTTVSLVLHRGVLRSFCGRFSLRYGPSPLIPSLWP